MSKRFGRNQKRRYPREVQAQRMAHELTHMVLDQLNKLGVGS